jgi:four helix bundle protein
MHHPVRSVRKLNVYRLAFESAMIIYNLSKDFPLEEKYSLTDQMRRSSRSVCSHLAEAWRKRKYRTDFVHRLRTAAQEAGETQTWLEFALECDYISDNAFKDLDERYEHIFAMLISMEDKADSFCRPTSQRTK